MLIGVAMGLLAFCGSCSDVGSSGDAGNPEWVKELIRQFEAAPVGNPPQSIWKYTYRGATVYYVPPQCCDQYSTLYDANGKVICAPDGGFTGGGDGRCPDFFQERNDGTLLWRDPRTR